MVESGSVPLPPFDDFSHPKLLAHHCPWDSREHPWSMKPDLPKLSLVFRAALNEVLKIILKNNLGYDMAFTSSGLPAFDYVYFRD